MPTCLRVPELASKADFSYNEIQQAMVENVVG
jgi:hypothetical protein